MVTIEEATLIRAPVERCFDLSLSIDLHTESAARTGERAIAGVTSGLIGKGQEVTWRARHLGVTQTMTVRIAELDRPLYFRDCMVRGTFRRFDHEHFFSSRDGGVTEMRDVLSFAAPPPLLGRLTEPFLRRYLLRFLRERNALLRRVAEGDEWRRFLNWRESHDSTSQ